MSLGVYPDVTLKNARERRDDARKLIAQGTDPAKFRKDVKAQAKEDALTFESAAREWYAKMRGNWTDASASIVIGRLERTVFPLIGGMPIKKITSREMLSAVRKVEALGYLDTARRVLQLCSQIFRFAVASGLAETDPTPALRGALQTAPERHHPSITDPKAVGELMRAV